MNAFDWQRMLLDEVSLGFLGEVLARTLLAYTVVFLFLKVAGRRGVRQLSLFELVAILTLGVSGDGKLQPLQLQESLACTRCGYREWAEALHTPRVV